MSRREVICAFGISGVGKTSLISRTLAAMPGWLHLQASALIKEGLATPAVDSDMLRRASGDRILANQLVLVEMFERALATADDVSIVVDGHLVIDSDDGLIEIPLSVIAALSPTALVHVEERPSVIAERRARDERRRRPPRAVAMLDDHQARSRALCAEYARSLDVPFLQLGSGAMDDLTDLLKRRDELRPR